MNNTFKLKRVTIICLFHSVYKTNIDYFLFRAQFKIIYHWMKQFTVQSNKSDSLTPVINYNCSALRCSSDHFKSCCVRTLVFIHKNVEIEKFLSDFRGKHI